MLEQHRKLASQGFIALIVTAGIGVVCYSMIQAVTFPDPRWGILATLAGVSALFPVSLPRGKGRDRGVLLTVSTIFSFASILIFGAAIAALVTTVEACMSTWKSRQLVNTPQKALFNIFQLPLITFTTAKLFYWAWGTPGPLVPDKIEAIASLFILVGMTGVLYFALNAVTIASVIALVTGQSLRKTWHESFFSAALTNFAESCAAVVIFLNFTDQTALIAVGVALPTVIVIFYAYKTNMNRIHEARQHLEQVDQLYHSTIEALAMAVDAKDQVTHGHLHRVQVMTLELACYCGVRDESELEGLRAAALLHDIGKLATPDHILNKPSSLTDTEMETMKAHATVGADILASVPFPYPVSPYVRYHHEKWDGSGYPEGLTGEAIPLGARILSIVDCYDALRSDRPYRSKLSRDAALDYIASESGKSFDPFVVEQLVNHITKLEDSVQRMELGLHNGQSLSSATLAELGTHSLTNTVFHNIASVHREVQAISDLSQSMGRLLNVSETMALLADKTQKLVPHDACSIFLIDSNNQELVPYSTTGLEADKLGRQVLCVGEGLTGWVAAHRRALAGVSPAPDFVDNAELAQIFRSGLAVPLILDDNIVGVITLYSQSKEAFRPNHLRIVETISGYAATALSNAIMYEETKEDAYTDMLTGLPNLRYFQVFVEQELRRAERSSYPVTLIMMDLDRFKEVNDELGHKAGDRVLIEVAHILRNHMRRADTVVRYGGDEFVGILPGVSKMDSVRIVRQIQEAVDNHPVSLTGNCTLQVGFSMGSATFPEDATSLDSLLTISDKEMYRDKLVRAEHQASLGTILPFSPKEEHRNRIVKSNSA